MSSNGLVNYAPLKGFLWVTVCRRTAAAQRVIATGADVVLIALYMSTPLHLLSEPWNYRTKSAPRAPSEGDVGTKSPERQGIPQ